MVGYPPLPDQQERDRFCSGLETNFSVIAPAGVGKTTSIVARVIAIAEADARRLDDPVLPKLVVVTYTKKAADEMFSRVRTELDRAQPHAEVHAHLAQAFFGTIHSFCQRLLLLAGPLCGFPSEAEIATDSGRLWEDFRRELGNESLPSLPPDMAHGFALFGKWEDVFKLAKEWPGTPLAQPLPGLPPRISADGVLAVEGKGRGRDNILLGQERFRQWVSDISRQLESRDPLPCPEPKFTKGGVAFQTEWQAATAPLRRWRSEATTFIAAQLAINFARYRRQSGQFTFDDLITFARQLLRDEEACSILRRRKWRVILDEAQDTDPQQFVILSEVVRPPEARGCWLDGAALGPRPGAFSMVGDPQQSIYSDRADLGKYLEVHHKLLADGGEQATFSVTMRCPVNLVANLNATFPAVFKPDGEGSRQVKYVTLDNPAGARLGQCVRHAIPLPDEGVEARSGVREGAFAHGFAGWLKNLSPEALGTDSWGKVAILCPRNRWLDALAESLTAVGLPIQQISRSARRAGDPVYAWFTALLTVFAHPRDSFELYGVLRDVFGFSDDALVRFIDQNHTHGEAHPLRLDVAPGANGSAIGAALHVLHEVYLEVRGLALYEAVDCMLERSQLAERLVQVPHIDASTILPTLDRLRQETAEAEGAQKKLAEWAEEQRRLLTQPIDERESSEEAITLVTAHKSKGLGFDVVILPFFFRRFGMPPEVYPCFETGGSGTSRVLFSVNDRDDTAKGWQEARRRELHERLLYVALTRVKRSLIVFDDQAWWGDLSHQRGVSWAELLKVDGAALDNLGTWKLLPVELEPSIEVERASRAPTPTGQQSTEALEVPLSRFPYWRRVTPSSLQLHEQPSARVEPDMEADERFPEEVRELYHRDPAAYGNWWHAMMEHAPWEMEEDVIRIHFENTMQHCPDPNRGVKEVSVFLEGKLFPQLASPAWQVHTEVPFLSGDVSSQTGYEGFIDLLAVNIETSAWRIIDWKTDRIPGDEPMTKLLHAYRPQLAVYDATMRQALGPQGTSALYSTVEGETGYL